MGKERAMMHKSRTERTCSELRDAIVSARFKPGQRLPIDSLGKTFEASIGAVREALSRLTAEGLVIAEPQKGFIVAPISRRELTDLTAARVEIECKCLADTIRTGDIDWEATVLSLQHKLRTLDRAWLDPGNEDAARWHEIHADFHDILTSGCTNTWWLRIRRQLYVQSERYRRISGPLDTGDRDITAEHDAIAAAAIARDTEAATRAMTYHLEQTTRIILAAGLPFLEADGAMAEAGTV